jgi:hypothetical protein
MLLNGDFRAIFRSEGANVPKISQRQWCFRGLALIIYIGLEVLVVYYSRYACHTGDAKP